MLYPNILPFPAHYTKKDGYCQLGSHWLGNTTFPTELNALPHVLESLLPLPAPSSGSAAITFTQDGALAPEAYCLNITPAGVLLSYAAPAGAFYGLITLGQLAAQSANIACCEIKDAPALPLRGLMLDISRGKIPTLETLYALVDKLALMKLNHFQLYIEGFSFAYPSFPDYWQDGTPLTGEDIQALDAYCAARFIDLAPNQNSLGHMGHWLAKEPFANLAEIAGGFNFHGINIPPTTLDPADSGSLALVAQMSDDLLPNFTSGWFNVGLDEPFELGRGKSKERAEKEGVIAPYLDYVEQLAKLVAARGKKMMMWGDILARHPGAENRLPAGVTVLEWGYEAEHPFASRCAAWQKANIPFVTCPGTSSWSSFGGISDNMLANTHAAAEAAKEYNALGMITTDWGDGGHLQYLPVSYAGYAAAAAEAWGRPIPENTLASWLDSFIYQDSAGIMGTSSLALGRFNRFEEFSLPCRTLAGISIDKGLLENSEAWDAALEGFMGLVAFFIVPDILQTYQSNYENRRPLDYDGLIAFLANLEAQLAKASMSAADGGLIMQEYQNTVRIIRLAESLRHYSVTLTSAAPAEQKSALQNMLAHVQEIQTEHEAVWMARNRLSGLAIGMTAFKNIETQLQARINSI